MPWPKGKKRKQDQQQQVTKKNRTRSSSKGEPHRFVVMGEDGSMKAIDRYDDGTEVEPTAGFRPIAEETIEMTESVASVPVPDMPSGIKDTGFFIREGEQQIIAPKVDKVRMVEHAYRFAIQQHMADVHMFIKELQQARNYFHSYGGNNEAVEDWMASRTKFWDDRLHELKVPSDNNV